MDAVGLVTLARVTPIEHERTAVRTVTDFHSAEPRIGCDEEVGPVLANVAAAAAQKQIG